MIGLRLIKDFVAHFYRPLPKLGDAGGVAAAGTGAGQGTGPAEGLVPAASTGRDATPQGHGRK